MTYGNTFIFKNLSYAYIFEYVLVQNISTKVQMF